jgi:hypothetical protein
VDEYPVNLRVRRFVAVEEIAAHLINGKEDVRPIQRDLLAVVNVPSIAQRLKSVSPLLEVACDHPLTVEVVLVHGYTTPPQILHFENRP